MARRIAVVSGGLGEPSTTRLLADRIAAAVTTQITARGEGAEVEFVELRPLAQDLATTVATGGLPTLAIAEAREKIAAAEGLVAVTPVFSASYSGLFKLFFDVLDTASLVGTPVLIAATAGSERHSLVLDHALRPLFSYLRAVVVPTGVFAATSDFGAGSGGVELSARIRRAASELACQVVAERVPLPGFAQREEDQARTSGNNVDTRVTPFADLLKGHEG
ncbi:MAG: CE1759 family FMN reductase [Segniliparus sp.]|uniref:CE1759 family FMN reductase n=1 Tax=Segniliparus sp. TaxID=2804064 RepID=UPI003F3E6BEC